MNISGWKGGRLHRPLDKNTKVLYNIKKEQDEISNN